MNRDIGACVFTVKWNIDNGKSVSSELQAVREKYLQRSISVITNATNLCTVNGNIDPQCAKRNLSPQDYALLDGAVMAMNFLKSPQNPNTLPNHELANAAYCGPLMDLK